MTPRSVSLFGTLLCVVAAAVGVVLWTFWPGEEPVAEPVDDLAFRPASAHEEALAAYVKHSGEGVLRCALPTGLAIDTSRLDRAALAKGVLTLPVGAPEGVMGLHAPGEAAERDPEATTAADVEDQKEVLGRAALKEEAVEAYLEDLDSWTGSWREPVALVRWTGAEPGRVGACAVERVLSAPIAVSVTVQRPDGKPAVGATVVAGSAEPRATDGRGVAEVMAHEGLPTPVFAVFTEGAEPDVTVSAAHDYVVAPQALTLVVDERAPEAERVVDLSAIAEALKEPVSPAARAQLREWRDQLLEH